VIEHRDSAVETGPVSRTVSAGSGDKQTFEALEEFDLRLVKEFGWAGHAAAMELAAWRGKVFITWDRDPRKFTTSNSTES